MKPLSTLAEIQWLQKTLFEYIEVDHRITSTNKLSGIYKIYKRIVKGQKSYRFRGKKEYSSITSHIRFKEEYFETERTISNYVANNKNYRLLKEYHMNDQSKDTINKYIFTNYEYLSDYY